MDRRRPGGHVLSRKGGTPHVPVSQQPRRRRPPRIADGLNARLADGLDLHGQIKVAHWNVKGPHFASLHPLFETFAVSLANFNDAIAERAVTLGAKAYGTARHVAAPRQSRSTRRGRRRGSNTSPFSPTGSTSTSPACGRPRTSPTAGDGDTVDLLTQVVTEFEKNAWFLRATAEGA